MLTKSQRNDRRYNMIELITWEGAGRQVRIEYTQINYRSGGCCANFKGIRIVLLKKITFALVIPLIVSLCHLRSCRSSDLSKHETDQGKTQRAPRFPWRYRFTRQPYNLPYDGAHCFHERRTTKIKLSRNRVRELHFSKCSSTKIYCNQFRDTDIKRTTPLISDIITFDFQMGSVA